MGNNTTIVTTAAGIENLEWLPFSFTQGMSRDLVESSLLGTPGFEGYRYATKAETASLLLSYYTGPIHDGYNSWQQNAGQGAERFLIDFGITKVIIPSNQNPSLDMDNGNFIPYDMIRLSHFYCGAYGIDLESNLAPPATIVGHVGEALNGIQRVAGQFTYGEMYGLEHQGRRYFSSLLVRDKLSAPTNLTIT